ncbi:MAG: hypothetical protein ACRDZ8_19725 [Acidimicrobiales bacterium]
MAHRAAGVPDDCGDVVAGLEEPGLALESLVAQLLSKRSSRGVPLPTTRLLNWYMPVYRHARPGEQGASWL